MFALFLQPEMCDGRSYICSVLLNQVGAESGFSIKSGAYMKKARSFPILSPFHLTPVCSKNFMFPHHNPESKMGYDTSASLVRKLQGVKQRRGIDSSHPGTYFE